MGSLKSQYDFKAGQYVSLEAVIDGADVRRSYSICSPPESETLSVGIKEVKGGKFSLYANRVLKVGDFLKVGTPEGRYTYERFDKGSIMIFASGSGITPNMSIIKTALKNGGSSKVHLVYGNRTPKETMFLSELKELKRTYSERFGITYVFSRYNEDGALFGRIDRGVVKKMTRQFGADEFYICGPKEMNDIVSHTLEGEGVSPSSIYFESFQSANTDIPKEIKTGDSLVQVTLNDKILSVKVPRKKNILEILLKEKIDAPYSCQGGVCASCIAKVKEGEVTMLNNQVLTDEEIADGMILTCQSYPKTPLLKIDYDDV
ncbi:flavodoxin reductase [Elysia marginata]|uniref:Flavodoxin reductase n=1 Tax=Elysia marginata TaxID=1093978 RepID=A0AAV4G654_9GAST|nr:flavodoxin reductase [Elysia marginata]